MFDRLYIKVYHTASYQRDASNSSKYKEFFIKNLLALLLFFTPFSSFAGYEFEYKYMRINQDLYDDFYFEMDAINVGFAYVTGGNYGLRLEGAMSNNVDNKYDIENEDHKNKIEKLFSVILFKRWEIQQYSFELGVGQTDYDTDWTVNGKDVEGLGGVDSDFSFHFTTYYAINEDLEFLVGYTDIYRKDKNNYGKESTYSFNIGLKHNL